MIECPKSALQWKEAEKWLCNITGQCIKISDNERIVGVHDDIPKKTFVTNMLIVCTKLLIYRKRKKGEGVHFRDVLYLMYKEYKADEYNAEITGTREPLNVRCLIWRF